MNRFAEDVVALTDAEAVTAWSCDATPFSVASYITAARRVVPELEPTPEAISEAEALGVRFMPIRWPNGLRAVVAWRGSEERPPETVVLSAYRWAWGAHQRRLAATRFMPEAGHA
jgi:hypothetical protein